MADLKTVASAKILAFTLKTAEQLDIDILALQRRNAAKGNLNSGSSIKELISICKSAFIQVQDEAIKQYDWVIEESLIANLTLQKYLENDAVLRLKPILKISNEHLQKLTEKINSQDLYSHTSADLKKSYDQSLINISLFLEGKFRARPNQLIKKIFRIIPDLITKLLGMSK